METFLNSSFFTNFFTLKAEYLKIILFIWEIVKCTFLLVVSIKLLKFIFNKFFKKILSRIDNGERKQQFLTLKTILIHIIEAVIFAIYAANILHIFGIDIRPFLAAAGVLGVAVGFGAKRFVEDIITGLIILAEGQIRVGDYINIHGMSGFVEKITLPMITMRSEKDGAVYYIRCGYIDTVINHTMQYSYAFIELNVAYKENIDHVFKAIKDAFCTLKSNEEYKKNLASDEIEIFGADEFKDSSICIKCRIKTQPKGQWLIKRAFNKIIKEQFDKEGIEIPFNQIVVRNIDK